MRRPEVRPERQDKTAETRGGAAGKVVGDVEIGTIETYH